MGTDVTCENSSTEFDHYHGRRGEAPQYQPDQRQQQEQLLQQHQQGGEEEEEDEDEKDNNKKKTNKSNLLISNIPSHVTQDDVKTLITKFAQTFHLEKVTTSSNSPFSFLANFESESEAQYVFDKLSGYNYHGSELKAELKMDDEHKKEQEKAAVIGAVGNGATSSTGEAGEGSSRGGSTTGGERQPRQRQPQYPFTAPVRPADFPLRILVQSDMVGAIIGRSGLTIKRITQESHARVDVHRKENVGSYEKVITIYGHPENCSKACRSILEVMQDEANTTHRGEVPLKILAYNNLIGRIIGKSGITIKRIMEQTNTKIAVSSHIHYAGSTNLERVITINGSINDICVAETLISTKLKKCYDSDLASMVVPQVMFPGVHPFTLMSTLGSSTPSHSYLSSYGPGAPSTSTSTPYALYGAQPPYMPPIMPYGGVPPTAPGLPGTSGPPVPPVGPISSDMTVETVNVYIPKAAVGAIIGTGGNTIRDMITSSKATIKVAQPSKEEAGDIAQNERKVTITGTAEAQWKAQYMIYRKVSVEGHSNTPDATLKVEMFVPASQVGRIIGKGGQNVRELQRLTRAIIKLPEEQTHTADEIPVHIIGDFYSTQAAQRQIRALIVKATQVMPPGVGGPSMATTAARSTLARPKSFSQATTVTQSSSSSSSQQPTLPYKEEPSMSTETETTTTTTETTSATTISLPSSQSKDDTKHSPSAPSDDDKKW